jgi:hypothetical protein
VGWGLPFVRHAIAATTASGLLEPAGRRPLIRMATLARLGRLAGLTGLPLPIVLALIVALSFVVFRHDSLLWFGLTHWPLTIEARHLPRSDFW